jgi:hypothetical protein
MPTEPKATKWDKEKRKGNSKEFADVFSDELFSRLPPLIEIWHQIDI